MRVWYARLATIAGFLSAAIATPVQAQERLLEPSGGWEIVRDDESCTLTRPYRAISDSDTTLYIRSFGPLTAKQVSIVGPTVVRGDRRSRLGSVAFDDLDRVDNMVAITTSFEGQPMIQMQMGFRALPALGNAHFARGIVDELTQYAVFIPSSTSELAVNLPRMDLHRVALGDLTGPIALLRDCDARLAEAWGFDSRLTADPRRVAELTNYEAVYFHVRYPTNLMINRVSRIVHFRMRIDENGEAGDCVVQGSSSDQRLFEPICRAFTSYGEFTPGTDSAGNPVPSLWRASLMLMMFD